MVVGASARERSNFCPQEKGNTIGIGLRLELRMVVGASARERSNFCRL